MISQTGRRTPAYVRRVERRAVGARVPSREGGTVFTSHSVHGSLPSRPRGCLAEVWEEVEMRVTGKVGEGGRVVVVVAYDSFQA